MAQPTREYLQWLDENNFSPEDEQLILKTASRMTLLWFLLSCIPTLGIFFLPLLINAWTQRKIIKQKSFEPRPGLLFSLFAVAMYISYILIIPWIFAKIARKAFWGAGLRKLIKQGKVGNGHTTETDPVVSSAPAQQTREEKTHFPWAIIFVVVALIVATCVIIACFGGAKESSRDEPMATTNHQGSHATIPNSQDHHVTVPDFSTATSVDEILSLAKPHLQVELIYNHAESGMIYDHIPEGMVIDYVECRETAGAELPAGSKITVTIYLKYQYDLTGYWYNAECTYDSLYLAEYYFGEDGTFSYYFMGYMAVDYETDLYTYGTYWDGAMGAESYNGTYRLNGNLLELSYDYWDWGTESTEHTVTLYDVSMENGSLNLNHIAAGFTTQYLPGRQPAPDAVLPFRIDGSWYALGTPEDGSALPVHTFYFWSNGEFKSNRYCYLHSNDGWYFPGGGATLVGTYTFDGTTLTLHYTDELVANYDNDGNIIGTDPIPCNETQIFTLTINGNQLTSAVCEGLMLNCLIQTAPSPYIHVDIMGQPLEHANQLYP